MRPGGIGLVFPGPGHGKLNKCRSDGGENEHENTTAIHAAAAVPAAATAENTGETGGLREQGERSGERGGDGTGEDVTIPHMPQLVSEHAFQLLVIEELENTLGDRDRSMLGVASGRECVGRIARND